MWETDSVTPAKALRFAQDITGVYSTITHSIDSRLRGNDATFFRKHDYPPFASFGITSPHLPIPISGCGRPFEAQDLRGCLPPTVYQSKPSVMNVCGFVKMGAGLHAHHCPDSWAKCYRVSTPTASTTNLPPMIIRKTPQTPNTIF